jgi:hypothetical protein
MAVYDADTSNLGSDWSSGLRTSFDGYHLGGAFAECAARAGEAGAADAGDLANCGTNPTQCIRK